MTNYQNNLPNICIIVGPTAVGKTDISLAVARNLYGVIISADSAQIYKYMDIGTAKLMPEEMQGIKHYMINEVNPDENFSVAEFRNRAEKYIDEISQKEKLPVITGGTGLYIHSLLNNLEFTDTVGDEKFRNEMNNISLEKGNEFVRDMLKKVDPISYERLHPNDIRRIIRALEVYNQTGKPISYYQEESKKTPPRFNFAYIGLTMQRDTLYKRIDKRVDIMIDNGLVEEVRKLLDSGYDRNLTSMQALGYKEIVSYLEGEITLDEAVRVIKRDSRHYAKRQLTWFRRDPRIMWYDVGSYFRREIMVENIIRYIAGKITLI